MSYNICYGTHCKVIVLQRNAVQYIERQVLQQILWCNTLQSDSPTKFVMQYIAKWLPYNKCYAIHCKVKVLQLMLCNTLQRAGVELVLHLRSQFSLWTSHTALSILELQAGQLMASKPMVAVRRLSVQDIYDIRPNWQNLEEAEYCMSNQRGTIEEKRRW